jgi:thymidylate synthase (FAD)
MRVIKAGYEILPKQKNLLKKIELVARTCYKSEDLITEDSCIKMVNNLIKRNHCYDTETEILTLNGWKKYNEINNNDLFATLNENGFVEYLPSAGYTCYEYSGKMIKVNTHMVDLLVTDKHKMYVCKTTTKEGRKKEKYELLEADTLLNTPHAYLKKSNGYVNSKTNIPLDVLRLLGFAIGDGSISHSLTFHLSKERKIKYLKDICNNLKLDITSSKDSKGYIRISIGLTQSNLVDYAYLFKDIYNSEKEKKIPHELLKMMDKEECEALLDGLQNSDGHTTKDNSSYYCTTSEELKGQFQQLCLHCGYSSNEVGITDLSKKSNFNSNKILSKMSIIKRENTPEINKSKNTKGTIEEIDNWNGLVWCVNIPPYHNVYVRRNGKPVWCGNCAMLEHASLVFQVDETSFFDTLDVVKSLEKGLFYDHEYETFKSYLRFTDDNARYIISGNIRAWIEFLQICNKFFNKIPAFFSYYINKDRYDTITNDIDVLFKDFINVPYGTFTYPEDKNILVKRIIYLSELSIRERLIHQDLSVKFTSDLLIQRELVRHRDASFAGESTRYCNYSLDKFGNEITVIEPCFLEEDTEAYGEWKNGCEEAEKYYFSLLNQGLTPEKARDVLPAATKCDTVVTANIREWIHILELRALGTTGKPHPKMLEIMVPLAKELATGLLSEFTCIDSVNKMLDLSF